MKRYLFIIILTLLTSITSGGLRAQNPKQMPRMSEQISARWNDYNRSQYFGIRIGVNASQIFFSGCNPNMTTMAGMNFGFVAGFQVSKSTPIFFETGISYTGKGAYIDEYTPNKVSLRQHHLQVPLTFKYKIETNARDFYVQPLFGPYLSFGISGETRFYNEDPDLRYKRDTFGKYGIRAFDLGLRMGCGLSYRNFYFEMTYDLGLLNTAANTFNDFGFDQFDNSLRSGCLSTTIGIDF